MKAYVCAGVARPGGMQQETKLIFNPGHGACSISWNPLILVNGTDTTEPECSERLPNLVCTRCVKPQNMIVKGIGGATYCTSMRRPAINRP